ncbi:exocyst complex component SEC15B [Tanacetum coccineum]
MRRKEVDAVELVAAMYKISGRVKKDDAIMEGESDDNEFRVLITRSFGINSNILGQHKDTAIADNEFVCNDKHDLRVNVVVLKRACDSFFRHATKLCGILQWMVERSRQQFPLSKTHYAAEEMISRLLKKKSF